uniref:Uncharacterized protein n=1 Tax=Anguilla anguilla TaxID=7936 RepID=A0A0E9R881_ANGAN
MNWCRKRNICTIAQGRQRFPFHVNFWGPNKDETRCRSPAQV